MYFLGVATERNYAKAYELYLDTQSTSYPILSLDYYFYNGKPVINVDELELQAAAGDDEAMLILAERYFYGACVKRNITASIKWLTALAEKSTDKDKRLGAQFFLGQIYSGAIYDSYLFSMQTVPVSHPASDYTEAVKWYALAANGGNIFSQYQLGRLYMQGLGVEKSYAQAAGLLTKVADTKEDITIPERLKYLYEGMHAESLAYDAAYLLAQLYSDMSGDILDYEQAAKWYEKAARNGDENAIYELGQMYEKGLGVKQDYKLAVEWYEKNLESERSMWVPNDAECKTAFALAGLYAEGNGVEKDMDEAFTLYYLASQGSVPEIEYAIAIAYKNGIYIEMDLAEAHVYAKRLSVNPKAGAEFQQVGRALMVEILQQAPLEQREWIEQGQYKRNKNCDCKR